jgi:hypothetical protein
MLVTSQVVTVPGVAPAALCVSRAQLLEQLRLVGSSGLDAQLDRAIAAAVDYCENYTSRSFGAYTVESYHRATSTGCERLPDGSTKSVVVEALNGQAWEPFEARLVPDSPMLYGEWAKISATPDGFPNIRVTATCDWTPTAAVISAILLYAEQIFSADITEPGNAVAHTETVDRLLEPYVNQTICA